jgi:peptidoglycan/LPS O-acetylase OafA/YrhL
MEAAVMGVVMGVLLPMILGVGAFVMIVYIRKFENVERMAIIEKGLDPNLFKRDKTSNPSPVLRWSLLLVGAGLGLFAGYFLDRVFYMEEVGYFAMLMIFGGLGLMLAYMVEERKARERAAKFPPDFGGHA